MFNLFTVKEKTHVVGLKWTAHFVEVFLEKSVSFKKLKSQQLIFGHSGPFFRDASHLISRKLNTILLFN